MNPMFLLHLTCFCARHIEPCSSFLTKCTCFHNEQIYADSKQFNEIKFVNMII